MRPHGALCWCCDCRYERFSAHLLSHAKGAPPHPNTHAHVYTRRRHFLRPPPPPRTGAKAIHQPAILWHAERPCVSIATGACVHVRAVLHRIHRYGFLYYVFALSRIWNREFSVENGVSASRRVPWRISHQSLVIHERWGVQPPTCPDRFHSFCARPFCANAFVVPMWHSSFADPSGM